eukprot:TRINITY_DN11691_c0_g1_i1.p1 TRINITY_DN11691_c0_g1~~TRINITY_DN11691_c0_g1_i1.p1  ORF type:complete len:220 (-),score=14.03 TRINITY_DN11691_c0_g1_i1:366-1025(-)
MSSASNFQTSNQIAGCALPPAAQTSAFSGHGTAVSPINLDDGNPISTGNFGPAGMAWFGYNNQLYQKIVSSLAMQICQIPIPPQCSPLVFTVVSNCMKLIQYMLTSDTLSTEIFKYPNLTGWIDHVLFRCESSNIRIECSDLLTQVCTIWITNDKNRGSKTRCHLFILDKMMKLLDLHEDSNRRHCQTFNQGNTHIYFSRDFMELANRLCSDILLALKD